MERMLINASQRDEKRVAIVAENVLFDFISERPGYEQKNGNIYLAKITSIEPSLDAVFVDFGSERHGFLPVKEISREYFSTKAEDQHGKPNIKELLRVGQSVMVQVEKEERGNKGAALTTYISLAGSYLVLMPNSPRAGGISRRIEGDERDQLREVLNQVNLPEGMGLIVRTAAIGRSNEELKWDLDVLLAHWKNIDEAAIAGTAPFLIHQEGNVVIRAIRDYVRQDTAEIIIDDEEEFKSAKHYLEQIRPDMVSRLKLYSDPTPLFSRYGIEHQIETAYKRTIDLPSGASIVIDYTEALVSIDINSARATKGSNIEATAFNTNIEAAEEIARQLRLRDIGGLIVIDFIDMLDPSNQVEVEKHLSKCLKNDRARIQIQRISRFGLLEMSRQRLRPSLRDVHQNVCPTCNGHGTIRSVESVSLTLVRIIEEEALKPQTTEVVIQASTEAATYILNEKRHLLAAIEKNHDVKVSIIPNPNLQSSNYLKKRIRLSDVDSGTLSSSDRLQEPQVDISLPTPSERSPASKPAVQQLMPTGRPEKPSAGGGLIKRLINSMFGQQEEEEEGGTGTDRGTAAKAPSRPTSQTRPPSGKQQRGRRPSRTEETQDSRRSRESGTGRGGRSTDRSDQRSADSRQRSQGSRYRNGGGRSGTSSKTSAPSKGGAYETYQDTYKEYSQSEPKGETPAKSASTESQSTKTPVTKQSEEAPITIKASKAPTGGSAATKGPEFKTAASDEQSKTPTTSTSTSTPSQSSESAKSAAKPTSSFAPSSSSSQNVSSFGPGKEAPVKPGLGSQLGGTTKPESRTESSQTTSQKETPTSSTSSTTEAKTSKPLSPEASEEQHKPIVIRATPEDKSSQGSTTSAKTESKDKESTDS